MIIRIAVVLAAVTGLQAQEPPPEAVKKLAEMKARSGSDVMFGAAAAGGTFRFIGGQMLNGNPVKGQPYSAEAVNETTQVLADGNRIVNSNSSMLYRDSEGRERREESFGKLGAWNAQGPPPKMIFISDPVAKVSYSLDEHAHTAMKMPMAAAVVRSALPDGGVQGIAIASAGRGADGEAHVFNYETRITTSGATSAGAIEKMGARMADSNAKVEKLGSQSIEGILADGTRTTVTIPAGQIGNQREIQIVDERWFSPELQVTVMSKHSDPRMGETVYKLTKIDRTEPARTLFEVPADYTVDAPQVRKFVTKDEN